MVYTVNGVQYTRRKKIPVTGAASGAQTDYQIKLAAIWAAAMQADFDDVRFTKADMQTLIDAWLESKVDSTSADIWVEFPATPADGVEETKAYMYFGNTSVVSDWHATNTFIHAFDQHASWTEYDPNSHIVIDQTAQTVTLTNVNRNEAARVIGATSISSDFIVEWEAIYSDFIDFAGTGIGDGDEIAGTIDNGVFGVVHNNGLLYAVRRTADVYSSGASAGALSLAIQYYMRLERIGTTANMKAYSDVGRTSLVQSATVSGAPSGTLTWGFVWNSYGDATNSSGSGELNKYRVRKYAANPPTSAFGTEEHQRRTPMIM